MNLYALIQQTQREVVSTGNRQLILTESEKAPSSHMQSDILQDRGVSLTAEQSQKTLILLWSQLGDFDNLEYAWWLKRDSSKLAELQVRVIAIAIGNRQSGLKFCEYTGFPTDCLYVDPTGELHRQLGLYSGLTIRVPGLSPKYQALLNLTLMCAGIGSPGTLREVLRGYTGDRSAPQLIGDDEEIAETPLPTLKGSMFKLAGGSGFQRPFELATLRLRNMSEVLSNWNTYVPDGRHVTQRGATFLFDRSGKLLYEHRDRNILGFAANMSNPLAFLRN